MTFPELDKKFDNIVRELADARGKMMVDVGIIALKDIKDRIINTGVDAKGSKYRPYSTKAMLVGCKSMNASVCNSFFGKENNKKHKWRTVNGKHLAILPGGYKKLREMHNRRTDITNFSWSNDMWNDINIRSNQGQHEQGTVIIGAKLDKEKKKLAHHTKDRGDILDLNPTEILELYKKCELTSLQVIRNNGL